MKWFFLVFLLFAGHVQGTAENVFSATDIKRTTDFIIKQQNKNGMWNSLVETDHAITALESFGITIHKSKKICKKLSEPLSEDLKSLYHTIRASKALHCADIDISSAQPSLQDAISGTAIILKDAFYAWKVILFTDTITDYDFQTTVGLIVELFEEDGSFRDSTNSDDASAVNAGYAMQMVGEIFSKINILQDEEEVTELIDGVAQITKLEPTIGTDISPIV